MSEKYRDERRHHRHRKSRSPSPREDWRNTRIKEEPVSDVEGSSRSKSHTHSHRDAPRSNHSIDRDRDNRSSSRYSDYSSRDRESFKRPRSRSPSERDRSRRDRDRERPERVDRPIKQERRSRSRSPSNRREFTRPPAPRRPNRDEGERRDNNRRPRDEPPPSSEGRSNRDSGSDGPARPFREPKRERDWENFFNPESDMSRQAEVKRERENIERQDRIQEYGGGGGEGDGGEEEKQIEKEKPNFGLSGKLTEETNTYRGVVIKYSEPPEARKPIKTRWRLYPFKEGEALEVMYVHRQSAYLLGRERKIADIPIDHPSCSKQHAVLQYRLVPYERPNGMKGRRIRPYIIDLESSNGTFVNGKQIESKRYVELFEKDVLKFGFSSREYVLLHEHSQDDDPLDDDGYDKTPSPEK